MTPLEEAIRLCSEGKENFWTSAHLHARSGWVFITPDFVLIADDCDNGTAFVWLVVGPGAIPALCSLIPPHIKRIAWARGLRDKRNVVTIPVARIETLSHVLRKIPQATRSGPSNSPRNGNGG